ncbi:MAG TPA: cupin domain-containing protein [Beijerinckiaceae bacterium]|jgi:cupin 2 domain-containing protein
MPPGNLFSGLPEKAAGEEAETLLASPGVRIERIVSMGQASPPGFWYHQEWDEWVAVLAGAAGLLVEGEDRPRTLKAGDHVHLPAHRRHRVEWTDAAEPTIWLAVHFRG